MRYEILMKNIKRSYTIKYKDIVINGITFQKPYLDESREELPQNKKYEVIGTITTNCPIANEFLYRDTMYRVVSMLTIYEDECYARVVVARLNSETSEHPSQWVEYANDISNIDEIKPIFEEAVKKFNAKVVNSFSLYRRLYNIFSINPESVYPDELYNVLKEFITKYDTKCRD